MIRKNEKDLQRWLSKIAAFVSFGDATVHEYDLDLDGWYLGGGYWRAKAVRAEEYDPESALLGVRLINPERTFLEICIVEKAACICLLGDYSGPDLKVPE